MGRIFALVVVVGLIVGFAWPGDKSPAKPVEAKAGGVQEVVLTRGSNDHFYTDVTINGNGSAIFMVDTGASMVALSPVDAQNLGLPVDPSKFEVVAEGASGPVRGQPLMLDSVEVGGIKVNNVYAVILENSELSLLGQSYLGKVDQVSIAGDYLSLRDSGS